MPAAKFFIMIASVAFVVFLAMIVLTFFVSSVVPGFTLSMCWNSHIGQLNRLAEFNIEGPIRKNIVEETISVGTCVKEIKFLNEVTDSKERSVCKTGKSFIVTSYEPASAPAKLLNWVKDIPPFCVSLDKKFSKEIEPIKGSTTSVKEYCIRFENIDKGPYKVTYKVGKCEKD